MTELPASQGSCVGGSASRHTCFGGEAAAAAAAIAAACSASSSASLATCRHAQLLMQTCFTNRCLLTDTCNYPHRKQHLSVKAQILCCTHHRRESPSSSWQAEMCTLCSGHIQVVWNHVKAFICSACEAQTHISTINASAQGIAYTHTLTPPSPPSNSKESV